MSVEWLKGASAHTGPGKSTGLTFKEQDEQDKFIEKKKAKAKKKQKLKIDKAIDLLKEAILSEMDELVKKHQEKCRRCKS